MNPRNILDGILGIPGYIRNVVGNAGTALDRFIPGDQSRKPPALPQMAQPSPQPLDPNEIARRYQAGEITQDQANELLGQQATTNTVQPSPQPSPQPQSQGAISPEQLQTGFNRFSNPPPPIAQYAPQLAQAGQGLPDPLLPAVIALMETGGLDPNKTATPNNAYNLGPGFAYPDPATSIVGGGPNNQKGLEGVLKGGLYDDYLQSGDLADFFNKFTPPGQEYGNPSMEELIQRYMLIRELFGEGD